MSEERTEQATSKKLTDARQKGQVLRSKEVHDVMQFAAVVLVMTYTAQYMVEGLSVAMAHGLTAMGHGARRTITAGELTRMGLEVGRSLALLVGPIALASIVGAVASAYAMGGITLTAEPLTLNFNKLSPMAGLKKLAPMKAGPDLVRTLFALIGMVWVGYGVIQMLFSEVQTLGRTPLPESAGLAWTATITFFKRSLIVLSVLAGADYGLQKFRFMQSMKMTKQEVKDEHKNQEGNPQIKARVKRAQREMVRRRMLAAVKTATVVITNPTHIAVAIEYRRESMSAPKVVAMGADFMAEKIKAAAREHAVPMVENVTLARALYANAEVGETIPGDLFEAVAEVLAYMIRMKQLVL